MAEVVEKKKKSKVILIIILLVLLLISASVVGYLYMRNKQVSDIIKVFKPEREYTILLNQFIVNLQSENDRKGYFKVQLALMYTDKKAGEIIISNDSKIRDVILNNILEKSPEDILDKENILRFKKDIISKVNMALGEDIVKDVYFTDFIIQ